MNLFLEISYFVASARISTLFLAFNETSFSELVLMKINNKKEVFWS